MNEEIEGTIKDLVTAFLYYDRKEDESLPVGIIEQEIEAGLLTSEEIVLVFKKELERNL